MSNDLDLYQPGGLQPYSPGTDLQPQDNWGDVPVDYAVDRQVSSSSPQLFGTPLPGATPQDVERAISMIAGSYMASMAGWGHPASLINAAVQWLNTAATQPPRREQRRHSYDLHGQAGDPVAESFANYMVRFNASQEFVSNSIYFIEELERQQGGQQVGVHDQPRTAPTSDPLDSLSDDQYAQVVAINERAKAQTMDYLHDLWGSSFHANIRMVNQYFQSLPQHEQEFLGQMTGNWISGLNTKEIILGLYRQAIGAGSIGSGSDIAGEIAAIERLMVTDRKAYMKDDRMQARLRELYRRRDG